MQWLENLRTVKSRGTLPTAIGLIITAIGGVLMGEVSIIHAIMGCLGALLALYVRLGNAKAQISVEDALRTLRQYGTRDRQHYDRRLPGPGAHHHRIGRL